VVEATNIYFVVFKEGICTFHFEDISAHTETVRKRLLHLEETFRVSSGKYLITRLELCWFFLAADWIAHGIIDSIVDSFFPVLKEIEREVEEVEGVVAGLDSDWAVDLSPRNSIEAMDSTPQMELVINPNPSTLASEKQEVFDEKLAFHSHLAASGMTRHIDAWLSKWKGMIRNTARMCWLLVRRPLRHRPKPPSTRLTVLLKMTTTRRLVTTLTRLLYSKSEVIAQIRKRLGGQGEVAIYLGDVQGNLATFN
jgi:magnesium transporter